MKIFNHIINQARNDPKTIVLAEGDDIRVIEAAVRATEDAIASCVLVGSRESIEQQAADAGLKLDHIRIEDPETSEQLPDYAHRLFELRKKKGLTKELAWQLVQDPLHFADLMLAAGEADGSIAGARYTTGDRVRSALRIIGAAPGFNTVSSFMLMIFESEHHNPKQAMIFSECALVIDPSAEQLAEIAIASTASARQFIDAEPRVAMLSFSTNGSAEHPFVDKVREATDLVRAQQPDLAIDGEIQLDAALVASVAERKMSDSRTRGNANVLIFPDLNAANIGYKIAQRLGGATAIGPIMQGLNKPANDLSRGCSADDVYNLIALTSVQAQS
ncbi:MAG: phosphate acetyltransferase [Gammaproteobacteria bacterium]|nr:phosphate acetyltransferase [Gammaproteobacteria bacterium]